MGMERGRIIVISSGTIYLCFRLLLKRGSEEKLEDKQVCTSLMLSSEGKCFIFNVEKRQLSEKKG
jgi:hypothetical protein